MNILEATIRAAFPENPIPSVVAGITGKFFQEVDEELALRINGRPWPAISGLDWQYVGSPVLFREYMQPAVFAYYVPSYLMLSISDQSWLDWALEAIVPFNKDHTPRGQWWFSFADALAGPQRAALRAFLEYQRDAVAPLSLVHEELITVAETVWA
jgi:hypothetical protein